MPVGKLKMWDLARGFGFISNDLEGGEMFVHMIPVMVAFFGSVPPGFEFMRPLDPSQFYFGA